MQTILLDAEVWKTEEDVYNALLAALGSLPGHGRNLNALWDSITEGAKYNLGVEQASYLNRVQPPFHIDVVNVDRSPPIVRDLLAAIKELFDEASAEYGVHASIALVPSRPKSG